MRYDDLYTLTLSEYQIKMRGFKRNQEREYDRTRLIMFELISGNPHIKKTAKPRRPSDIFELSIDVKVELKPTKVTLKQASTIEKMGYKVPETFIKDGE